MAFNGGGRLRVVDMKPRNNRLADRTVRDVPAGVHPKGWAWAVRYCQEFANLEGVPLKPETLEQWAELLAGYERARTGQGPVPQEECPRPTPPDEPFENENDQFVRDAANACVWRGSKTDFAKDFCAEVNRRYAEKTQAEPWLPRP